MLLDARGGPLEVRVYGCVCVFACVSVIRGYIVCGTRYTEEGVVSVGPAVRGEALDGIRGGLKAIACGGGGGGRCAHSHSMVAGGLEDTS